MDRKYLFQLFTVHGVSLDCIDHEYSFSYLQYVGLTYMPFWQVRQNLFVALYKATQTGQCQHEP